MSNIILYISSKPEVQKEYLVFNFSALIELWRKPNLFFMNLRWMKFRTLNCWIESYSLSHRKFCSDVTYTFLQFLPNTISCLHGNRLFVRFLSVIYRIDSIYLMPSYCQNSISMVLISYIIYYILYTTHRICMILFSWILSHEFWDQATFHVDTNFESLVGHFRWVPVFECLAK